MPERVDVAGIRSTLSDQIALGHNSKAVHRAYSRNAQVTLPPLEDFERNAALAIITPQGPPDSLGQ